MVTLLPHTSGSRTSTSLTLLLAVALLLVGSLLGWAVAALTHRRCSSAAHEHEQREVMALLHPQVAASPRFGELPSSGRGALPPVTVLLAVDSNPKYTALVEPVKQVWQKRIGFQVMTAYVRTHGAGAPPAEAASTPTPATALLQPRCWSRIVPSAQQAQILRVLLPALFPDTLFLLSDADMVPISRPFFRDIVAWYLQHARATSLPLIGNAQHPRNSIRNNICYYVGYGYAFAAVTGVRTPDDVTRVMEEWYAKGFGWNTDEQCFGRALLAASHAHPMPRCGTLFAGNEPGSHRLDRSKWPSSVHGINALRLDHYQDSHLPRGAKHEATRRRLFQRLLDTA